MVKTNRFSLPNATDFLGWNGVYLLTLILVVQLFIPNTSLEACPCTGHIPYGIAMLGLPTISVFVVAIFVWFRLDDTEIPWKVFKTYQKMKRQCNFHIHGDRLSPQSQDALFCCQECQQRWKSTKLMISFLLSLFYALIWLSLGFLRTTGSFVCANVGPDPDYILRYCKNWDVDPDKYRKDHVLAINTSYITGGLMLVLTLTCIGVFVVVYGELAARVKDWKDTSCVCPDSMQAQLTTEGGNQERTGTSSEQAIDNQTEDAVYIKIKKEFYTSLQSCLEEGRLATVTFNCPRVEGLPRNEPFGSTSNSGRQREYQAASAPFYQQHPIT